MQMDLRTVVVDKLSRSNVRQYPMVYSQSLDQMPSLSRGNTPGTGLRESSKPTSSHRMSNASLFSADSHLSDLQGVHITGLLAPHSPPLSKYHNTYSEDDLMSFLSLRMPSANGSIADGVYTPRSISSGHGHLGGAGDSSAPSNQQSKLKLSKSKWGSSAGPMMLGKNIGDKDHNDICITGSPVAATNIGAPIPSAPLSYSIALDTSHSSSDRQFNFDNIDVSGPPSPVAQGRKELWDDEHSETGSRINDSVSASHRSFKAAKQPSSLPEAKHIVYNNKFSDGSAKFRTINSKRAEEPIGDLGSLIVSTTRGSNLKPIMSQSMKPQAQVGALNLTAAGLSSSSSLGHAGLSSITNVNSDTIKKMRKDLLLR
ncbi:hypothetical protein EON65_23245 [archaeon]|nr:MAG: hypothetical protein EON65_23245 [archaeon]